jgi:hypothetical protein
MNSQGHKFGSPEYCKAFANRVFEAIEAAKRESRDLILSDFGEGHEHLDQLTYECIKERAKESGVGIEPFKEDDDDNA